MRGQIGENLPHASYGRCHNNNVGFAGGLRQIPGTPINGSELLGGPLLIEARIKSDHFQGPSTIALALFGPTSKCEAD
jgi:hypothetical protein